ncbi:MAG TPA: DNA adenine methylase [Tissierellia bacterium]|nr:DNA adenine methylase [Tissierellia bacterium]
MKNVLNTETKPFVKWAGGKRQLLPIIIKNLPKELIENRIKTYIEPFVGGGAVFFYIVENYKLDRIILNDKNEELIDVYRVIQNNVDALIDELRKVEKEYLSLDENGRKAYFYEKRDQYNSNKKDRILTAVNFIFLNRTCFNGLYRVNKKGEFNVPYGRYKNPTILDEENLRNVSICLKNVELHSGDFEEIENYVDDKSFIYLDPPYRPLDATSNFTSYDKGEFNDDDQKRLAAFYRLLNEKGAKLMLSNSDPKNIDEKDDFFDELYKGFNIKRVYANRMINSNGKGRGKIAELLITNY